MLTNDDNQKRDLVILTTEIVAAYVANNPISVLDLPGLIAQVHAALSTAQHGVADLSPAEEQAPAVPIKKSVTTHSISCLECGLMFKSLRRHLNTVHNLRPDQYRARWNLPEDYPMVAPSYSTRRSELAKSHGLGRPDRGRGR